MIINIGLAKNTVPGILLYRFEVIPKLKTYGWKIGCFRWLQFAIFYDLRKNIKYVA